MARVCVVDAARRLWRRAAAAEAAVAAVAAAAIRRRCRTRSATAPTASASPSTGSSSSSATRARSRVRVRNGSGGPQAGRAGRRHRRRGHRRLTPGSGTTNAQGTLPGHRHRRPRRLDAAHRDGIAELPATPPSAVRMSVQGAGPTLTVTRTFTPGGPGAPTPTPMSIASVTTIFMETEPFTVSSQNGGDGQRLRLRVRPGQPPAQRRQPALRLHAQDRPPAPDRHHHAQRRCPTARSQEGVAHVQIVIPPGVAAAGHRHRHRDRRRRQRQRSRSRSRRARRPCDRDGAGADQRRHLRHRRRRRPDRSAPSSSTPTIDRSTTSTSSSSPRSARSSRSPPSREPINGQGGTAQTTLQIPAGAPVLVDDSGNILPYTITRPRRRRRGHRPALHRARPRRMPRRPRRQQRVGRGRQRDHERQPQPRPRARRRRARGAPRSSPPCSTTRARASTTRRCASTLAPTSRAAGALLLPANLSGGYCSVPRGRACADRRAVRRRARPATSTRATASPSFTDRAGNAQIQVRSGTGLGTVTVVAEIPSELGEEFTQPCTDPRTPGERCIISNGLVVTVTAGLPGRLSLTVNDALHRQQRRHRAHDHDRDRHRHARQHGRGRHAGVVHRRPVRQPTTTSSQRIGIVGFPVTNALPPCDVDASSQQQTGIPVDRRSPATPPPA